MAPKTESASLDLRGWDTVSAVRIGDLNKAIRDAGTTPPEFSQPVDARGKNANTSANFRPWQVLPDGDGEELKMQIDFEEAVVDIEGQETKCGGGVALITVRLEMLPTDIKTAENARKHVLVVAQPNKRQPITVDKVVFDEDVGFSEELVFDTGLGLWLNGHITKFSFYPIATRRSI